MPSMVPEEIHATPLCSTKQELRSPFESGHLYLYTLISYHKHIRSKITLNDGAGASAAHSSFIELELRKGKYHVASSAHSSWPASSSCECFGPRNFFTSTRFPDQRLGDHCAGRILRGKPGWPLPIFWIWRDDLLGKYVLRRSEQLRSDCLHPKATEQPTRHE